MRITQLIKRIVKQEISVKKLKSWGAIIGEDVELYNFTCSRKDATCLKIGDHVTLSGVHIITHDASPKRFLGNDCNMIGRVVIGSNVFIGIGTIILPNVYIGDNVIIGAGSIVTHNIPSNCVACGNPAHRICDINEFVNKHKKRMIENTFYNINREMLNVQELAEFNDLIDGKVVYLCSNNDNQDKDGQSCQN